MPICTFIKDQQDVALIGRAAHPPKKGRISRVNLPLPCSGSSITQHPGHWLRFGSSKASKSLRSL